MIRGSILLFVAVIMLLPSALSAASIRGYAPGLEGKTLRLIRYHDRISYLEEEAAITEIDKDGWFSLETDLRETTPVILAVGFYRGNLVLQPGASYELHIDMHDFTGSGGGLLNPGYLEVRLTSQESGGLNEAIDRLENEIDSFLATEYDAIFMRRDQGTVRQFIARLDSSRADVPNSFFRSYLRYTIGYLESLCYCRSWGSSYLTYFRNARVEYSNPAFMDLFHIQFDDYFLHHSPAVNLDSLVYMVNRAPGIEGIVAMLDADTLFRSNPRLGELVKVNMFQDMFTSKFFAKEEVISKLSRFLHTLRYPENSLVAQGILEKYRNMMPGIPAPELRGQTASGDAFDLAELKGRRVLLLFWNRYCLSCMEEFGVIGTLTSEVSDSLNVVAVIMEEDEDVLRRLLPKLPEGLTYVQPSDVYKLSNSYHVNSLPLHVHVGSDGTIIENPSIGPFGDLNMFLVKIVRRGN